jgi:hypothetical protein
VEQSSEQLERTKKQFQQTTRSKKRGNNTECTNPGEPKRPRDAIARPLLVSRRRGPRVSERGERNTLLSLRLLRRVRLEICPSFAEIVRIDVNVIALLLVQSPSLFQQSVN